MGRTLLMLAAAAAAALCGCQHSEKSDVLIIGQIQRTSYAKIEDAHLVLEVMGPYEFEAGKPAALNFTVVNRGGKEVEIVEWYSREQDNVKVECQLWTPDMTEPDPDAWVTVSEETERPARRFPALLPPLAQVWVSEPQNFVQAVKISPGMERRYFVRAKLNLTSVDAECPPFPVIIRPASDN